MIAVSSPVFTWAGFAIEPADIPRAYITEIALQGAYRPVIIVKNVGRSPLQLRSFCIETIIGQQLGSGAISVSKFGSTPVYREIISVGYVVEAGKTIPLPSIKTIQFTPEEAAEVNSLQRQIWIYGIVTYFNQFRNETWEAGFSAIWQGHSGFMSLPVPNYDYHRRHQPSGD
jgi:hypothetical protein